MENICDLAKARTTMPPNLVSVMPERTELPMLVSTFWARSTLNIITCQRERNRASHDCSKSLSFIPPPPKKIKKILHTIGAVS